MIIMHIMGGIGNQLFQYAMGRWLAHKHNTELKLEIMTCLSQKNSHHNYYRLCEFNIQENFATEDEIKSLPLIREDQLKNRDDVYNLPDNVYLYGYWQNEKCFNEIRDILLREISLKNPLGKNSAAWKEKILAATCAVSLHVRFGDFLSPLLRNGKLISFDFYEECINRLKKEFPDLTLFVFSDDLEWCKENFKFNVPTEFVEGCETDAEEMYLMSLCRHNIIPNSTFSWWGAWLNKNPNKKVFLKENGKMLNYAVNISVGANARPLIDFPPNLSIILYAENNSPEFELSFNSAAMQDFPDYEVIIVDASEEGDRENIHQLNGQKNFTVLTVNRHTTKTDAWNKGLEVARGDYVLFLTTKDFIVYQTAKHLAQALYDYLKVFVEPLGKYLTASHYGKDFPNIICTNKFLEEDAAGNAVINGMPDKKFSLKVDVALQNLNTIAEIFITENQKLMTLATQGINNFIGTKFFKRTFLNENNIRFEGGGAAAPLLGRCVFVDGKNYVHSASLLRTA